jgi:hypothetical protein
LFSVVIKGQSAGAFINYEARLNYLVGQVRNVQSGELIDLKEVKGSPYETESFQPGTVSNKKLNDIKSFYFRYNIFNDIMEMKESQLDEDLYGLIKSLNIYTKILGKEYHYEIYTKDNKKSTDEGYFILISKGEKVSLYLRKTKTFIDAKPAKDTFRKAEKATFKDFEDYYYKTGRVLILLPTKKKGLLEVLSDHETEIKKYIKEEKINLKNERDLIKLMNYYGTLI